MARSQDGAARSSSSAVERVPPHNLDAEQSLLGSMLLSKEAVEVAVMRVRSHDFYRSAHSRIYDAIQFLFERNEPVDAVTVADRLEATGDLDAIGGKPYLIEVTNSVPTAANADHYASIIKRTATLRGLITASTNIAAMCYDNPDDVDVVVAEAERQLFEVTQARITQDFKPLNELMEKAFEHIEELFEKKLHVSGVPTGFADLDKVLAGLHGGDLVILAARPSVGKTAFALNLAVNAALKGTPTAVFSLEMDAEQLVVRILCSEARIDMQKVRSGYLEDADWPQIMTAMGRLGTAPIHIDDTPSLSILELRAKARRLFRSGNSNGLIIVDYLQLMQPHGRRTENRQVEIAEISRGLKILAKEAGVPVIALSQLSRAVEQRQDKRPVLSDLRESGAIEQDADVVMFIHRDTTPRGDDDHLDDDERRKSHMPPKGEAEIIIAKHRNGPTGVVNLAYLEPFTKFLSIARMGN